MLYPVELRARVGQLTILQFETGATLCSRVPSMPDYDQPPSWRNNNQNGYCFTFDLSIAIQPEPAKACGVPDIRFKLL
jgi:hypothetical protein